MTASRDGERLATGRPSVKFDAPLVEQGGAGLQGRVEPRLLAPLAHRGAVFRYSSRSLVHSRDPELLAVLGAGQALLSRLEGDWSTWYHVRHLDAVS